MKEAQDAWDALACGDPVPAFETLAEDVIVDRRPFTSADRPGQPGEPVLDGRSGARRSRHRMGMPCDFRATRPALTSSARHGAEADPVKAPAIRPERPSTTEHPMTASLPSSLPAQSVALPAAGATAAPHRGHHHHASAPASTSSTSATGALSGNLTSDQSDAISSLSDLLGTDPSTLVSQLQSGSSLSDLPGANGVPSDALSASLQKGMVIDTQA